MSLELHVNQLLRCNKEHFGLGPGGIFAMNEGDLLLVVDVTSHCQGRAIRLDDGAEISILTLDGIVTDDAGCFVGTEEPHYTEVSL